MLISSLTIAAIVLFFMGVTSAKAYAQEIKSNKITPKTTHCTQKQPNVIFNPLTIFDENEKGITFLHRWANAIHIETKQITLENEAAFFLNKCSKTFADMAELERHLRSRRYLRDAQVTSDVMVENITVNTWDNWSLMPTINFGRQGGETSYSLGMKERNLLGLGIDAEIETYKNSQRKGYKVKTTIPLFNEKNIDLKLRFADNDDGTQQSLFLKKHFASFYTHNAYSIGFNEETRHDTIYQNNHKLSIYSHDISYKNAEYAWLDFNNTTSLLRYSMGITQDYHDFSTINLSTEVFSHLDKVLGTTYSGVLPQDRHFIYPWVGFEYIEKDFRKLTNIHLITQIEDFNHGWQFSSRLGVSDGKKDNSAWALFQAEINKGFEVHKNGLILLNIALDSDIYDQQDHRVLLKMNTEYFYNISTDWGFYLNNTNVISKNQYLDKPVTVGGDTGLRGFPLQYQHGKRSTKFTAELRYYPHLNIFKLFDIAGTAFFDMARTFGYIDEPINELPTIDNNIEPGWLYALGMGVRLYSPHAGGNNHVVHIDFAFPQSNNPDIDNFEIRLEAKRSF
jgi:hypothetical protein